MKQNPKKGEKRSKMFEKLHEKYKHNIYDLICDLKGFYIKLGQLGAARTDLIPIQWVEELRKLEDNVPYESFEYVKSVIERDYGKPINEVFSEFGEKPLGSASIGQV